MFPLSKLAELSPRTRLRKAARILQGIELDASGGRPPDTAYLRGLLEALGAAGEATREEREGLATELGRGPAAGPAALRALNALRNALLRALSAEPSEWDLVDASTGALDRAGVDVLPMSAFLEDLRSPFNVGSIFRSAEAFGAARILLTPRTPLPTHPRAARTALGAAEALPWQVAELEALANEEGIFALELGGTDLASFTFPARGVVLVGSEELGLSPEALAMADLGRGRVSIPLAGAKRSLNVSVALGILMQAWRAALGRAAAGARSPGA